jgi:uncharacterized iron-regulated membrane protein
MYFKVKKSIRFIHLWLGLLSGLVVFIISITGAVLSFESEISDLVYSYRKVAVQKGVPILSISRIKEKVQPHLNEIQSIAFLGNDKSIEVREIIESEGKQINNYVNLNPYSGEILKVRLNEPTFFDYVLNLHMNLLFGEVGAEIVKYVTLIFLLMLISGIYLWWPKKKKGIKQRVSFDWKSNTKWRRKNFDLHSIVGFYASWIIIFSIITGAAWSFKWIDKTLYSIATLGSVYKDYTEVSSISNKKTIPIRKIDDYILDTAIKKHSRPIASWHYYFAQKKEESISVYLNPEATTWYQSSSYYFDQRSAQLLLIESPENKNNGQYIRDMYYDIHVGKILGFTGQLLLFFSSVLAASLPVTGFMIWYGRRKKKVVKFD